MMIIPHLILKKDNQILLTRRAPTKKIWPGYWHCVTGSIEEGESPREAIIRETEEEIGIKLKEVNLATTIFLIEKGQLDPLKNFFALELFFVSNLTKEQHPVNAEPLKQDAMDWFYVDQLPEPMVPGVVFAIKNYLHNISYAEFRNV